MGRILRRVLAMLVSLAAMAGFYAFAVLMEDDDARVAEEFVVHDEPAPVTRIAEVRSADARELTRAFGASIPVPGAPVTGRVVSGTYHGYVTRVIEMQGAAGALKGVRPASAAPSIMPADAVFLASDKALLGFPLLRAGPEGQEMYALMTNDAAFLLVPSTPGGLAGFAPGGP